METDEERHRRPLGPLSGFAAATGFLTGVPVAAPRDRDARLAEAAWAFPLVGAGIGALAAAAFLAAELAGLGGLPAALLAVLAGALVTGGLHEDGLADTADGFLGGHDRAGKLAIMRDSRHGTFGVLALVLSVALRAAALGQIGNALFAGLALVAAHAVSRGLLPVAMWAMAPARPDGLGAAVGRPAAAVALLALAIGVAVALAALGPVRGAIACGCAGLAVLAAAWVAQRQIGGHTGDVLGAFQQTAEIVVLLVAAAR